MARNFYWMCIFLDSVSKYEESRRLLRFFPGCSGRKIGQEFSKTKEIRGLFPYGS